MTTPTENQVAQWARVLLGNRVEERHLSAISQFLDVGEGSVAEINADRSLDLSLQKAKLDRLRPLREQFEIECVFSAFRMRANESGQLESGDVRNEIAALQDSAALMADVLDRLSDEAWTYLEDIQFPGRDHQDVVDFLVPTLRGNLDQAAALVSISGRGRPERRALRQEINHIAKVFCLLDATPKTRGKRTRRNDALVFFCRLAGAPLGTPRSESRNGKGAYTSITHYFEDGVNDDLFPEVVFGKDTGRLYFEQWRATGETPSKAEVGGFGV